MKTGAAVILPHQSPLIARPVSQAHNSATAVSNMEVECVSEDKDDAKVHLRRWAVTEAALGVLSSVAGWFSERDYDGPRARLSSKVGPAVD